MKIVLINPISGVKQLTYAYKRLLPPVPPLGLCYIAAILEKNNFQVSIIDQYAYRLSNEELIKEIEEIEPDMVGFSCLTPTINNIRVLSKKIRLLNKNIKILLGNLHATLFSEQILKEEIADMVVHGEGEYATLELVSAIRSGTSFSAIKGISYRFNGKLIHNPEGEPIKSLDDLPHPAWHLLKLEFYNQHPMITLNECVLPIQASRGCPFSCTFCAQDKIHKSFRTRIIGNVVDEIEYNYGRLGIKSFGFCDSFFPPNIERGYAFCEELTSRQLHKKIKWTTEMRVDQANEKLIKRMKDAGLHLIMFGFESGNQRILDLMKKRATIEQARNAVGVAKRAGVLTLGLFIIGMPGETVQTCKETITFAKELDCDMVKINIAVPYPGTQIYELYRKRMNPDCKFEDFTSWEAWLSEKRELAFVPEGMTSKDLIRLQQLGMFTYYIRPHFILKHLRLHILSLNNILFGGCFLFYRFFKSLIINEFREN